MPLIRAASGLAGQNRYPVELMFMYKIHLFETRLRQAKVELDWSSV